MRNSAESISVDHTQSHKELSDCTLEAQQRRASSERCAAHQVDQLRSFGESSSLGLAVAHLGLLATPRHSQNLHLTLDLQLSKAFEKAAANGLGGDFARIRHVGSTDDILDHFFGGGLLTSSDILL